MSTFRNKIVTLTQNELSLPKICYLVSSTAPRLTFYWELSRSKTVNLCLDISEFVVVLSFGDSEGVIRPNFQPRAAGYLFKCLNMMLSVCICKKFLDE